MNNFAIRKHLASGAFALGLTMMQASFVNVAQGAEAPVAMAVRVSDLNLAKAADVATLYQRIGAAASTVCTADQLTGAKLFGNERARCVAASLAVAVANVHSAALSAYHLQATAAGKI